MNLIKHFDITGYRLYACSLFFARCTLDVIIKSEPYALRHTIMYKNVELNIKLSRQVVYNKTVQHEKRNRAPLRNFFDKSGNDCESQTVQVTEVLVSGRCMVLIETFVFIVANSLTKANFR